MAKRTLQSCWKQFEKLAAAYLAKPDHSTTLRRNLNTLCRKANEDNLGSSLVTLFVRPHLPLDLKVEFVCDLTEGIPAWQTAYDSENSRIIVHPVAVVEFSRSIQHVEIPSRDEDFLRARWLSFLAEIGKLPTVYILFLLVLQRVAYLLEIAHLEKRGGVVEVAEDEAYHTLLWAFKEFEVFAKRTWGLNLRARHGISWYESEWITGR
jgi:hypothetical protein